ncbi:hypothetical protein ACJX0J_031094, partial [Zea mays]
CCTFKLLSIFLNMKLSILVEFNAGRSLAILTEKPKKSGFIFQINDPSMRSTGNNRVRNIFGIWEGGTIYILLNIEIQNDDKVPSAMGSIFSHILVASPYMPKELETEFMWLARAVTSHKRNPLQQIHGYETAQEGLHLSNFEPNNL